MLTVVPVQRRGQVRLMLPGGKWEEGFTFSWPLWRSPIGLAAIGALLAHPRVADAETRDQLGIDRVLRSRRISVGKFMNFTLARVEGRD